MGRLANSKLPSVLAYEDLRTVRTDAAHLAASFFDEIPEELGALWSIMSMFEKFILHGSDGTKEYAPQDHVENTVVKLSVVKK